MSNRSVICPACSGDQAAVLENIDVAKQHCKYAPGNSALQARLTIEAAKASARYRMVRCLGCGLEYCDPMAAPNADWYSLAYDSLHLYPDKRWEFDYVLAQLEPDDRLFEIGCGSGAFLRLCREKGIVTQGADFSSSAVDQCREAGLDVSLMEVGGAPSAPPQPVATRLVAFQVLEHLDCPETLFVTAARLALPNAALWIAVPSDLRPTRLLKEDDFLDQPPHHMTRWTGQALEKIGSRCGWELETLVYEPISTRATVWWIASRTSLSSRCGTEGPMRRVVQRAQYPYAFWKAKTKFAAMTGFSMLAQFRL